MKSRKILSIIMIAAAITAAVILFLFDPSESIIFPKCPFYVVTGYKCPGCGTLRGIHALLHGHILEAIKFNLLMVISIPVLVLLFASRKVRNSPLFTKIVLAVIILWWIVRNTPLLA